VVWKKTGLTDLERLGGRQRVGSRLQVAGAVRNWVDVWIGAGCRGGGCDGMWAARINWGVFLAANGCVGESAARIVSLPKTKEWLVHHWSKAS